MGNILPLFYCIDAIAHYSGAYPKEELGRLSLRNAFCCGSQGVELVFSDRAPLYSDETLVRLVFTHHMGAYHGSEYVFSEERPRRTFSFRSFLADHSISGHKNSYRPDPLYLPDIFGNTKFDRVVFACFTEEKSFDLVFQEVDGIWFVYQRGLDESIIPSEPTAQLILDLTGNPFAKQSVR